MTLSAEFIICHDCVDRLGVSPLRVTSEVAHRAALNRELGWDCRPSSVWPVSRRTGWASSGHVGWMPRGRVSVFTEMWQVFVEDLIYNWYPRQRGLESLSLVIACLPKQTDKKASGSGFKSQFRYLQAGWLWASDCTSLGLSC